MNGREFSSKLTEDYNPGDKDLETFELCSSGLQNKGGSYRQNTQNNITCLSSFRIGAPRSKGAC